MPLSADGYVKPRSELVANADILLGMAADLRVALGSSTRILDFGCGLGDTVEIFLERGLDAWGVDVKEYWGRDFSEYWESRSEPPARRVTTRLRVASLSPYQLPFPDAFFDFACSEQVFEHVQDYVAAFRELRRVLKPGAVSIHIFPARWRPLEIHTRVPLGSVFQSDTYLRAWARAGVRAAGQQRLEWREVARINASFLRGETNYPSMTSIRRMGEEAGVEVSLVPSLYIKHHPWRIGGIIRRLSLPGVARLFCSVAQRPMIVRRPA